MCVCVYKERAVVFKWPQHIRDCPAPVVTPLERTSHQGQKKYVSHVYWSLRLCLKGSWTWRNHLVVSVPRKKFLFVFPPSVAASRRRCCATTVHVEHGYHMSKANVIKHVHVAPRGPWSASSKARARLSSSLLFSWFGTTAAPPVRGPKAEMNIHTGFDRDHKYL